VSWFVCGDGNIYYERTEADEGNQGQELALAEVAEFYAA